MAVRAWLTISPPGFNPSRSPLRYRLVDGRCVCAPGTGLGAAKAATITVCKKCNATAIQPATGWLKCVSCPTGRKADKLRTKCL